MEKIDKLKFQKEHHSRNIGLLTASEHKIISDTTVLIAGCGVGSQVALSAVRIGFEKFIIIDGDKVELSNLNRQGYSWRDVDRYKVDALAHKMKAINPHVQVKKYPVFLDTHNSPKLIRKADIIVDAIDPVAAIEIVSLHKEARKLNKPIILPLDIGWGAGAYVFDKDSISYEKLLGIDPDIPITTLQSEEVTQKFIQAYLNVSPNYVKELIDKVLKKDIKHYPQPVTATSILSSLVVILLKKIALKQKVKKAPNLIYFDPEISSS